MTYDQAIAALQEFMMAWHAHAWVLCGAVVTWVLVAGVKQGWGGAWLAARVPAKWRPVLAYGIGTLGMVASQVMQGQDWRRAALMGLYSAAVAVLGHQVIVAALLRGQEPLPAAPWMKAAQPPPSKPAARRRPGSKR